MLAVYSGHPVNASVGDKRVINTQALADNQQLTRLQLTDVVILWLPYSYPMANLL